MNQFKLMSTADILAYMEWARSLGNDPYLKEDIKQCKAVLYERHRRKPNKLKQWAKAIVRKAWTKAS